MEIKIKLKLQGWFPDIYNHNKPPGLTDNEYVNAIISSWLIDKDEKNPIPKPKTNGE